MKKTTRWVCALALGLALWGPMAMADDGAGIGGFFESLVQQIEQLLFGPDPAAPEGPTSELGILLPPGG